MEKRIRDQFNQDVLHRALEAYAISPSGLEELDGFENYIYACQKAGTAYILRIGHEAHRTAEMMQGEAEFLNYLAAGGLSVPRVFASKNGLLVEKIPAQDGSCFCTMLFDKASGHAPRGEDWSPSLFAAMGQFMGRLHHLGKGFKPSAPRYTRLSIEDDMDEFEQVAKNVLPDGDQPVLEKYLAITSEIGKLPKTEQNYGLIHVDFHGGNFFVDDAGHITLFDFDDCQFAWFAYDLAMALFYVVPHDCHKDEDLEKAQAFLQHLVDAYRQENPLDAQALATIPLFLKLREVDLYIAIHRSLDVNNLDPWCASFMKNRREKICNDTPYCAINYKL